MHEIWFWQRIISPHMVGLAEALVKVGCTVHYVVEQSMTADRIKLGWKIPELIGIQLHYMDNDASVENLVNNACKNAYHICQGIRANGRVSVAQRLLAKRDLIQWIVMETIDDRGWRGFFKRLEYSRQFYLKRRKISGVLACGYKTESWVVDRGMYSDKVYQFAYFLPDIFLPVTCEQSRLNPFRFVYVGQLNPRKRVDWLINALSKLTRHSFDLFVVGTGVDESSLKKMAQRNLANKVHWLGKVPSNEVQQVVAMADCLVLPSHHDGWGAVVSEALMVGTPVICSDACGAAGVVMASGSGGVFRRDQFDELQSELDKQLQSGSIDMDNRIRIASWARALGAEAGARYLMNIFDYSTNGGFRPLPPWQSVVNE